MSKNRVFIVGVTCLSLFLGILLINQITAQDTGSSGTPSEQDWNIEELLNESPTIPEPNGYHWPLIDRTGTEFVLNRSPFTNLKITSSEEIHLVVGIITTCCISFHLEPVENSTKTETVLEISGLAPLWQNNPNGSYWLYQDGYPIEKMPNNEDGTYTWTQDLSRHHISIQTWQNTLYIGLDLETGPLSPYYDYDPVTLTYTLKQDIIDQGVVIVANGVTLDGNGHKIVVVTWRACGIYLGGRSGVTIRRCFVQGFWFGIDLAYCSYNKFNDNTVSHSDHAIYSEFSPNNDFISNVIKENRCGIVLCRSNNNTLIDNMVSDNESLSGPT